MPIPVEYADTLSDVALIENAVDRLKACIESRDVYLTDDQEEAFREMIRQAIINSAIREA